MSRLKNVWTEYKLLGVEADKDYNAKRRIIITNVVSFALGIAALLFPAIFIFFTQLPKIFLVGILQTLIICAIIPLCNASKRYSTAAILFSINVPLLLITSNLLHKAIIPIEELVQEDYYRSHLWLICSVAFPFISINPEKKRLQTSLAILPVIMIFMLNQLYRLFGKDFESVGFDIALLFRHNLMAAIVAVLLMFIFFFFEGITSSLQKELQIQADELEKLSIVAQETTNAVAILDKKGNFEWVNPGFVNIYELNIDELLVTEGHNIFETIPKSYATIYGGLKSKESPEVQSILSAINESIKSKKPVQYEYYTVTRSGKEVIVQTNLTPILDAEGNIKKLICIDSDISELKEAQNKIIKQKQEIQSQASHLKEFNEHLEELVSQRTLKIQEQNEKLLKYAFSNSHLVRAPVARILGLTELLNSDADLLPDVREKLLANIRISALELDNIIRDIGEVIADDLNSEES